MANQAAWLMSEKARPLVVKSAPMPTPAAFQVVVKIGAVAVNPVDANIQNMGFLVEEYPAILGVDMAGVVELIGSEVKHVKVGDRVLACADLGAPDQPQEPWQVGSFQRYSVTHRRLVAKIPDTLSYTDATVLPLAMATAATALFDKRCMGLSLPSARPARQGSTLLVWGGASSVGAVGIMLGVGAGFEVITTCSEKNFTFCKSIGAQAVFDYKKESVTEDVVNYLKGKQSAGVFDAIITPESVLQCYSVAHQSEGYKHVGTVIPPTWSKPEPRPADVEVSLNYGTWLKDNEVGDAVFRDWIPAALASGVLQCKPPARVVGRGLESIQAAMDAWSAGVSAEKIVVDMS